MTPSKKEKLIHCLENLQMRALKGLIQALDKKNFLNNSVRIPYTSDPNAAITEVVYKHVWKPHYRAIMANPNNGPFKKFLEEDIGPIKPSSILNSAPTTKFKR